MEGQKMETTVASVMPHRIEVSPEQLAALNSGGKFTAVAFDLFKETGCMAVIGSNIFEAHEQTGYPFERNQAICAGHLVRIFKLMMAVCRLASTGDSAEVNLQLIRSVFETATNLRFLLLKKDKALFDQFVSTSLGPERELYDLVQINSKKRGGKLLPIERRILNQVKEACDKSGLRIETVSSKQQKWGGSLREKLKALRVEGRYSLSQRFPSHTVHGDWIDLVTFHLKCKGDRFGIHSQFGSNTPSLYLPPAFFVLEAVEDYLRVYFPKRDEIGIVFDRIKDLHSRLTMVNNHYELWVQKNPPTEE
jgi:hypothetical protein